MPRLQIDTSRRQIPYFLTPLLGLVLLALPAWPVLTWLWNEWWHSDYYSHGFLIVLVSVYLIWRLWVVAPPENKGDARGLGLIAGGMGLLLYFMSDRAFYLAAFAIIITPAGLVWTFWGSKQLQRLAFPLLFLGLAVPLPLIERATLPLALWTGVCSAGIIHWLGVNATVAGNAVTLPGSTLVIGAQCSGVNSIMALSALTILAAYSLQGPLPGRLVMVALTVPLAMLGNILRVACLLWVARYFGTEAGFDFYHTWSGPVFFVGVCLLLIPLSNLLQCKTLRSEII
jgi:exosortase